MASVANVSSAASNSSARSCKSNASARSRRAAASHTTSTAEYVGLKDSMYSTGYIGEVSADGSVSGSAASVSSRASVSSQRSSSASARASEESNRLAERLQKVSAQAGLTSSIAADISSACEHSAASISHASVASRSSATSKSSRTSKTSHTAPAANLSKNANNTQYSDSSSISSHRSASSSKSGKNGKNGKSSAKGPQAEALEHLESGNCALAIRLFTQALGHHPRADKQAQQTAGALYAYRAEALYEVGAYEAAVRDARNALNCERLSGETVGDHPYAAPGRSRGALHSEKGVVLRVRALCTLGYSLLRQGCLEGVSNSFEDCISLSKYALEDEEDLPESERDRSVSHQTAVRLVEDTLAKARKGVSGMERLRLLKGRLDAGSRKKEIALLDEALAIAPAFVELHVQKVQCLVRRRRWFAVANHCEQVAATATRYEGVFVGDLEEQNPFPGVPALQELSADIFAEGGKIAPPHLRTLSPKAARDAAFRLPNEVLPYYLRALRLEERYKEAVLAGTALAEFDAASKGGDVETFAANKRFDGEWDKLDRTVKLKEEADALFRDGYYNRAVTLYGECLAIDGGPNGSILKQTSSYPVASPKSNNAGGKLHAVLHSNRAACFSSMGRYADAIKECSHALEIHSMYSRALLRRARCYAKIGWSEQARADFDQYVTLAEAARKLPHPPPNQGSACYFDMPSEVSRQQLQAVKGDRNALGFRPRGKKWGKWNGLLEYLLETLCCKKNAASQVATPPSHWPEANGSGCRRRSSRSSEGHGRRVSFTEGQPPQSSLPDPPNDSLIKPRPAFDHPLDPPSAVDVGVDYYAMPDMESSASDAEIKRSYHKLAREFHPDRNRSADAQARFQEIKVAHAILTDSKKKREFDRARARVDP